MIVTATRRPFWNFGRGLMSLPSVIYVPREATSVSNEYPLCSERGGGREFRSILNLITHGARYLRSCKSRCVERSFTLLYNVRFLSEVFRRLVLTERVKGEAGTLS